MDFVQMKGKHYELGGKFYTEEDGTLEGYAYSDGENWHIADLDGETVQRWNIFLDRDMKVLAPKNTYSRGLGDFAVKEMLSKYKMMAVALRGDRQLLRV